MDAEELRRMAEQFEGQSLLAVLVWAVEHFAPHLTCATGFGAEGCVLIDLIGRHRLPIDLFTLDTGLLFPATYELWRRLEKRYGVVIRSVRPAFGVAAQARQYGPRLWERDPDRCCKLRKLEPLRAALEPYRAWVSAIRRDQTPERATAAVVETDARFGLVKVNPLVAWSGRDVWDYVRAHDVPYNPLHNQGYPSIGCEPCTSRVGSDEDERAGRWRGRDKRECGIHLGLLPKGESS